MGNETQPPQRYSDIIPLSIAAVLVDLAMYCCTCTNCIIMDVQECLETDGREDILFSMAPLSATSRSMG